MLKEQTTTYAYKLKYLENPTFDRIRASANTFINELPTKLTTELYDSLNRGTDLLDSEPSMLVYLFSFGKMHQAKLNYAFSKIPDGFMEQSEINIIDYGCGQAVGTMCYADYLKARGNKQKIKSITLIEPSEICLKRAALHASVFFPDAEIKTINKKFDELDDNDISTSEDTPTLHILSNVLDLDFDLRKFSELIKSKLVGYNQFVCVDPYFGYSDKDQRMNKFANLIGGNVSFSKILEKGELNPDKNWTCQTVILSVGELEAELSTEVTDEEIRNGITDEDGVVYSRDGKRLLKCGNRDLRNYEIKKGTKVICDGAFYDCFLESIVIPSSVTSIGKSAFYVCSGLKSITIPSSVTSIGYNAFGCCWTLASIVIPSSVTSIGESAFEGCNSLETVTIPSSVTSIGESAFEGCNSLETVTIPSSVTSIGNNAFGGCSSLKSITIPSSVTSIGDLAFSDCSSLKAISIPSSVTSIGNNAFGDCSSLESIVLSSSVTSIGYGVFSGCKLLREIKIIDNPLFVVDCDMLIDQKNMTLLAYFGTKSDVTIPSSVTSIGNKAFCDCESMESVTIPSSVMSIGESAFSYCNSLKSITIPSSVTNIGKDAFSVCDSLESITLPLSVTNINDYTFSLCSSLESITIPLSVTNIKDFAFRGCSSLESIVVPSSVVSIGNSAFRDCDSLESITIPSSVTSIGYSVFYGCKLLREVKIIDNPFFVVDSDMLIDQKNMKLLTYFGTRSNVTIPSSVTSIGESAFSGCSSLESIIIPSSVTSIGNNAFEYCSSLESITIPSSVTSIGESAFDSCSLLESINIPSSVTSIGNGAFGCCESLKFIIIPEDGVEQFKGMLSKILWDKLYYLKKAVDIKELDRIRESDDYDLPF